MYVFQNLFLFFFTSEMKTAVKSAVAVCGFVAELEGRTCWHRQCRWQCDISVMWQLLLVCDNWQ